MCKALLDGNVSAPIKDFLINNPDVLKLKNVPKPFEDIIDLIFAKEIIKHQHTLNELSGVLKL